MAVENFEYLVQNTNALPATIGTIAGLPGGVTTFSDRGEDVPGIAEAQFAEDAIEDSAGISRRAAAAVRGGRRNEGLDESPLFVCQVHNGWLVDIGPRYVHPGTGIRDWVLEIR